VNGFSGLLQFVALPMLARRLESRHMWLIMPSVIAFCAIIMTIQKADNLHTVSGSFLVMKAMEYSVRGVTSEMVGPLKNRPANSFQKQVSESSLPFPIRFMCRWTMKVAFWAKRLLVCL
jgi:hypothetical protein